MTPSATADELEHGEGCRCDACESYAERRFQARARIVCAANGIAPWAHSLLGPGWVEADGKGGLMPEPMNTEQLAQRALGDVFEQIVRVAELGRDQCRGGAYNYEALKPEQLLKQHEADRLLTMIDDALDFARSQAGYLSTERKREREREPKPEFEKGERVAVCRPDDENTWLGNVVRYLDGTDELEVQSEDGAYHLARAAHVRKAAS